jgi:hypothetical protein
VDEYQQLLALISARRRAIFWTYLLALVSAFFLSPAVGDLLHHSYSPITVINLVVFSILFLFMLLCIGSKCRNEKKIEQILGAR